MLFVSIPVFASRAKLFIAAWWFHLCYVLAAHSEQLHWECFLVCVSVHSMHVKRSAETGGKKGCWHQYPSTCNKLTES